MAGKGRAIVSNHVDSFRYVLHLPDCLYLVPNHVYSCVQQLRLRYKFPYDCQLFSRHCPCFSRHRPRFFAINLVKQLRLRYDIPCYFPAIAQAFPVMEDDLSIFWVRTWTRHGKSGRVCLLLFFDMSLHCQDMMEDDLSIFWVRSWTRHGKLWVVRLLRFFDTSLRFQDMTEDDLSFFRVRIWIWHGKLGGVRFLRNFDTSLGRLQKVCCGGGGGGGQ